MPLPHRLLATLHRAIACFRAVPGRRGRVLDLQEPADVLVAGDLHGHVENFKRLLLQADLPRHPRRHLVFQELVHGPFRYPDGSDQSHRLLDLLAALKCEFPDQVHLLPGNHELSQWTERAILKNGEDLNELFKQGVRTAYGPAAQDIYQAYGELVEAAPVAIRTPNRVCLSHSLPSGARLDGWEPAQLFADHHDPEDYQLGGCIHAVVWGRDLSAETAARYLNKMDADLLITGHIPCEQGWQVPNEKQLILDCKDELAHFCLFPCDRPLSQAELLAGVQPLVRRDPPSLQPSPV